MVGNRFPTIQKKGDLVTGEDPLNQTLMFFKTAHQHGNLPETRAGANEPQNLPRSQDHFRFRIRAADQLDGRIQSSGSVTRVLVKSRKRYRRFPEFFKMSQRGLVLEAILRNSPRQYFTGQWHSRHAGQALSGPVEICLDCRPM